MYILCSILVVDSFIVNFAVFLRLLRAYSANLIGLNSRHAVNGVA
jgi:hypothetical protein